jgi:hypothetical protein
LVCGPGETFNADANFFHQGERPKKVQDDGDPRHFGAKTPAFAPRRRPV